MLFTYHKYFVATLRQKVVNDACSVRLSGQRGHLPSLLLWRVVQPELGRCGVTLSAASSVQFQQQMGQPYREHQSGGMIEYTLILQP